MARRDCERRYYFDGNGDTLVLHDPSDAVHRAMVAMGTVELEEDTYRQVVREISGGEPPTGG